MRSEAFIDNAAVAQSAGVAYGFNAPTKDAGNPLLPAGANTDTWDAEKSYTSCVYDAGVYRLFYYAGNSIGTPLACYATSADGLTFTKPNLGILTYGGNTNNNIIAARICNAVLYDATSAKWVMVCESDSGGPAISIYTADLPQGPYTLVNSFSPADYAEAKDLVRRADGRWVVYYSHGHSAQRRSIGAYVSDTTSLAGTWTPYGDLLTSVAATAQFYGIGVEKVDDIYYGFVMLYNSTTETIRVDLYTSRDALTWQLRHANWVPLGSSGAWDDSMIINGLSLAQVGDNWHFYYSGAPLGHNAVYPVDMRIGRASIAKGRIGQVSGTGQLDTYPLAPLAGAVLTVNANAVGGTLKIEVQDANGVPLAGFATADFDTITTDSYTHAPRWGGQPMPTGQTIKLKFTLAAATLHGYTVA